MIYSYTLRSPKQNANGEYKIVKKCEDDLVGAQRSFLRLDYSRRGGKVVNGRVILNEDNDKRAINLMITSINKAKERLQKEIDKCNTKLAWLENHLNDMEN